MKVKKKYFLPYLFCRKGSKSSFSPSSSEFPALVRQSRAAPGSVFGGISPWLLTGFYGNLFSVVSVCNLWGSYKRLGCVTGLRVWIAAICAHQWCYY